MHRYKTDDIREALVNMMTAVHYGSKNRAEAAFKSVQLTTRAMSREQAKEDNASIFWQGLSECVWLLQKHDDLLGKHMALTLPKKVQDFVNYNGDVTALAEALAPEIEKTVAYRKSREAEREKQQKDFRRTAKHQNLRQFIRNRPQR